MEAVIQWAGQSVVRGLAEMAHALSRRLDFAQVQVTKLCSNVSSTKPTWHSLVKDDLQTFP